METHVLELPAARPEFIALSEAEVWKAVHDDPGQQHPIAGEVTRLVTRYMAEFMAYFDQRGCEPPRILRVQARCPIEKVAVLMVVTFVEAEAGTACPVTFH